MSQFSYQFNFPMFKTAKGHTWLGQALHLESEVAEVREAIISDESHERVIEECLDVIHSAETLIRIIGKDFGVMQSHFDTSYQGIIQKNRDRGYYEKVTRNE